MQVIEYRDGHGYLLSKESPRHIERKLIFCPEINSLKHMDRCRKCEYFAKYGRKGLKCKSKKPNNPPEYYNKERPLNK